MDHTRRNSDYVQGAGSTSGATRLLSGLIRLEPLLILLLAPFFALPQPSWMPWLLGLLMLLWVLRRLAWGRLTVRTPLDAPMLGLAIMLVVSAWATYDLATSLPKLAGVTLGIALFYALANALRSERAAWLATGVLLACGALIAATSLVGTRWSSSKVPVLGLSLSSLYKELPLLLTGIPRAEQGFNANQVAGTLILFIPLAAALLVYRISRDASRDNKAAPNSAGAGKRALTTLGLFAVLALTAFVLLLTQSRWSYVAVVWALLGVGALLGRWPRVLALLVLLAGIALVAYYGVEAVGEALFGIPNPESLTGDASWAGRTEIWKRALRVIQDHPLTGIGFDTFFEVVYARYPTFQLPIGHDATHAHNLFLQTALNLGLPGLLAFLCVLGVVGWMLWRVWRESPSPAFRALAVGLFCGLLAHLSWSLADAVDLGAKPGVFLWTYFGLAAVLWAQLQADRQTAASEVSAVARRPISQPARTRRLALVVRLLPALVVVLFLAWGYGQFGRARTWRAVLQTDLDSWNALVQGGPQAIAPWQPSQLLSNTRSDLLGLRSELALPLAVAPHLGWLPHFGADVKAAPVVLQMAVDLTTAGEAVMDDLGPLLGDAAQGDQAGLERMVSALQTAQTEIANAKQTLEKVRQARALIPDAQLSPLLTDWVARFDQLLPIFGDSLAGATALPELLGASAPRTYLVLFQNEDELRATGGFITAVARVAVDKGRIVELVFDNSYDVDDFAQPYPAPPRPFREIVGAELWLLRDSNWSPDFTASAQTALDLYRRHYGGSIHGVMALDQSALQLFVEALEPLKVVQHPEPITGENVIQTVRESWAPFGGQGFTVEWREQRKSFMGRLLSAAVGKLQNEPEQIKLLDLVWTAFHALEQKHLLIYLPDDGNGDRSKALHQAGWDGSLRDTPGDYLMIVDSNLGFNKVNPNISESVSYAVDLGNPTQPRATLTVTHSHTGPNTGAFCRHGARFDLSYEHMMQRCYWDYVRVYVPQGSVPLEATAHPVPGQLLVTGKEREGAAEHTPDEAGKTVFSSFFVLAPGESVETRFVYDLPPGVVERSGDRWRYWLTIQKQAGTGANALRVAVVLPPQAKDVVAYPPPTHRQGNHWLHELSLETDLVLEYRFSADIGADD